MKTEEQKRRQREANARYRASHPDCDKRDYERRRAKNPDYFNQWARANPDKVKASRAKFNRTERAREYRLAWRGANPEKVAAYNAVCDASDPPKDRTARWRARNLEAVRAANTAVKAEWRARNMAKARAVAKQWREQNPDYQREWVARNPDAVRVRTHNRRARLRANGGKLSRGLMALLFEEQGGRCPYCSCELTAEIIHMDHYMPVALGGKNEDGNIQLLCQTCNLSKGDKHPMVFLSEQLALSKG